jgi:hypothetical protein
LARHLQHLAHATCIAAGKTVVMSRTFRQECLDHVVVFNERHLLALLTEFVHYYSHDRPHRTIELETPVPNPPISRGDVVSRPILGGLHHVYARAA